MWKAGRVSVKLYQNFNLISKYYKFTVLNEALAKAMSPLQYFTSCDAFMDDLTETVICFKYYNVILMINTNILLYRLYLDFFNVTKWFVKKHPNAQHYYFHLLHTSQH